MKRLLALALSALLVASCAASEARPKSDRPTVNAAPINVTTTTRPTFPKSKWTGDATYQEAHRRIARTRDCDGLTKALDAAQEAHAAAVLIGDDRKVDLLHLVEHVEFRMKVLGC